MTHLNVVLVGHDLLLEGTAGWLDQRPDISVLAKARSLDEALATVQDHPISALIALESAEQKLEWLHFVQDRCPDLPLIRCNVAENTIRVLRPLNFTADPGGLLAALQSLSQEKDRFGSHDASGGLS